VQDERICHYLQNICLNPAEMSLLQPQGLAHIFAYFSEMKWDHPATIQTIVERLMQLKPSELRAKDLTTFLWCCAQLNCTLNEVTQQVRGLKN